MKVGVVVLNWNGKEDTLSCLESLAISDYPSACLLVVDNGSVDGSVDELVEWSMARGWPVHVQRMAERHQSEWGGRVPFGGRGLFVLRLEENLGYTGGNNAGIEWFMHAGADAVMLLNNDTKVPPNIMGRMVSTLTRREDAGIVGCRIVSADSRRVLYQGGNLDYWLGVHFLRRFKGSQSGIVEVNFVPGCAMLVRTPVLRQVGGLREDLFLYTEDIEFCHRVRRSGWKIVADLDAVVWAKIGGSSGGPRTPLYYYYVTRNTLIFIVEELGGIQRLVALAMFVLARMGQVALWAATRQWDRIHGVVVGFADFLRGVRGAGYAVRWLRTRELEVASRLQTPHAKARNSSVPL